MSSQHLADRRQQILSAAVRCFARAGLHSTTMQDIFTESGLSPGGVYLYFKSKNDLIMAICHGVSTQLDALLDHPHPGSGGAPVGDHGQSIGEEVRRLISVFDSVEGDSDHRRVAVAIWNESLHDPGVASVISSTVGRITSSLADRVALLQHGGQLDPRIDPRAAAQVIVAMLPGYLLQRIWFPDLDPEAFICAASEMLTFSVTNPAR